MISGCSIAAITRMRPRQEGHSSTSRANTRALDEVKAALAREGRESAAGQRLARLESRLAKASQ